MDKIKFSILEDGTISIETDEISGENHVSADELLKQLAEVMGGPVQTKHKQGHSHAHSHGHDHSHGHTHNHN